MCVIVFQCTRVKRSTPELVVGFVKQKLAVLYNEILEAKPRLSHSIILFCIHASHLDVGVEFVNQIVDYPFLWVFRSFPLNVQVELARLSLLDELVEVPVLRLVQSIPQEILIPRIGCIHLDAWTVSQIIEGYHELVVVLFRILKHLFLRPFALHLFLEPSISAWWVRENFAWPLRDSMSILQHTTFLRALR